MIISFTNVIGAIRNAISSVITTNLKMWLGFETSVANQEKVVDGDFPTGTTAWTLTRSSISNNTAIIETTTGQLTSISQSVFAIGRTYLISLDIDDLVGEVEVNTTGGTSIGVSITSNGTKSFYFTPAGTDIEIKRKFGETNVYATISNVSVREITQITPDKSDNNNVGELFTGKALEFDGSTTYVSANSFAGTLSTEDAFTFAIWFNSDKIATDYFRNILISSGGPQQFTNIFKIGVNPQTSATGSANVGGIYFDDSAGAYNNVVPLSGGVNYNDGEWHRLVVSRPQGSGNQTLTFYVDGSSIGTAPCNPYWNNVNLFDFGQEWDGGGTSDHFAGMMSNIQVYDYAWTTDDVTYDYANPNKLAIDNPNTSLSVTNLKGYWALSEGDGLVAYDSGSNLEEEEVTNGDFADGFDDWSNGSDWSVANNVATLALSDNATNSTLTSSATLVSSKTYVLTYTISNYTSGELALVLGNISIPSTEGDKTFTFTGQTELSVKRKGGATALSITNISVREVTASDHGGILNGATYVDAQPRIPQLGMMNWSKGSNLLPYSEDFTQWVVSGGTLTPNFALSPNGTQTATKYNIDGVYRIFLYAINLSTSTEYTFSFYAKNISSTVATYRVYDVTNEEDIIATSYLSELSTTDWTRIDVTFNTSSTGTSYNVYLMSGLGTGDILFWGAQLEQSSLASAYRLTDGGATSNSTVIPNPTIPTQDIFGNAVRDRLNSFNLDGTGYSSVANNSSIKPTSALSIECWVKTPDVSSASKYISDADVGTTRFFLMQVGSKARFKIATTEIDSATNLTNNSWHYIAGTWDGTTMTLYVDEDTPVTISKSGAITYNTDDLFIGSRLGTGEYFDGLISDVRLYDRALSATEIENNYNAGLSAHTNN